MFNIGDYKKALSYFMRKDAHKKCGIICQKQKDYQTALFFLLKANEYSLVIETYSYLNQYQELFEFIHSIKDKIDLKHFFNFYSIYANKYLLTFSIKYTSCNFGAILDNLRNTKNTITIKGTNFTNTIIYKFDEMKIQKESSIILFNNCFNLVSLKKKI